MWDVDYKVAALTGFSEAQTEKSCVPIPKKRGNGLFRFAGSTDEIWDGIAAPPPPKNIPMLTCVISDITYWDMGIYGYLAVRVLSDNSITIFWNFFLEMIKL